MDRYTANESEPGALHTPGLAEARPPVDRERLTDDRDDNTTAPPAQRAGPGPGRPPGPVSRPGARVQLPGGTGPVPRRRGAAGSVPPGPVSTMEASRPLAEILTKARNADCPRCGSDPLEDCFPDWHLERVIRAWRYQWLADAEMTAVLEALAAFQLEMAFRHVPAAVPA